MFPSSSSLKYLLNIGCYILTCDNNNILKFRLCKKVSSRDVFIWCLHFFIVVTDALLTEVIVIVQFQVSIRFCQIFHLDHPVDSQRETDLKITFSPCFVWPKFPCTTKSEMLSQKIVTLSCLCKRVEECTILWLGSVPSSTQFQKTDALLL